MKRSAFTLIAFLAMTGVACASVVTLDIVDNGVPETGLHSYTLTATGTGIVSLAQFTITVPDSDPVELGAVYQDHIYQVTPPNLQTESHLSNPAPSGEYDPDIDSFVMFGTQRYPDMISTVPYPFGDRPDCYTTETLDDPDLLDDTIGWGTLNNLTETGDYDVYVREGPPSTEVDETVNLMQLVLPDGEGFNVQVDLVLYTATEYDELTGDAILEMHELTYGGGSPLVGDCDDDGDCDFDDFVAFGTGWFGPDGDGATNPEPPASWATGDFDDDGDVDFDDFVAFGTGWFSEYGDGGAGGGAAVPEPSTMLMLVLGGLCLIGYRLRK